MLRKANWWMLAAALCGLFGLPRRWQERAMFKAGVRQWVRWRGRKVPGYEVVVVADYGVMEQDSGLISPDQLASKYMGEQWARDTEAAFGVPRHTGLPLTLALVNRMFDQLRPFEADVRSVYDSLRENVADAVDRREACSGSLAVPTYPTKDTMRCRDCTRVWTRGELGQALLPAMAPRHAAEEGEEDDTEQPA